MILCRASITLCNVESCILLFFADCDSTPTANIALLQIPLSGKGGHVCSEEKFIGVLNFMMRRNSLVSPFPISMIFTQPIGVLFMMCHVRWCPHSPFLFHFHPAFH